MCAGREELERGVSTDRGGCSGSSASTAWTASRDNIRGCWLATCSCVSVCCR